MHSMDLALDRPLCFVLMPFGRKPAPGGAMIDFDAVYAEMIAPAVTRSGLEPIRADEELAGGIIHKPMFERLILCDFAVADLTTANANVFYELGVRHAVKSASTALIYAEGAGALPFDVGLLRGMPYKLGADGKPSNATEAGAALTVRLRAARERATDSPVFQLVEGFPDIQRLKTDVFRERVNYSKRMKDRLAIARKKGLKELQAIEAEVSAEDGSLADVEAGVVIDLFLSYRAVKAWDEMIALVGKMSAPLGATVMVQEQLGLALNRAKSDEEAEKVLKALITERGPSSETCGILGRVYKDRWEAALKAGEPKLASGLLTKAINAYLQGFESDWRDAYPGINAVTLMELKEPPDPRRETLLPVVRYAVQRRIAAGRPDYWDYATLLEIAVLQRDEEGADAALNAALAEVREPFEAETTLRNLRLILDAQRRRGEAPAWSGEIERELGRKAGLDPLDA
jgi:hypothetical protein